MSMSLILVPIAVAIFATSAEAVDAMQMKKVVLVREQLKE